MATMASKVLLVVAMAAAALGTALGASYNVGAPAGSWDLRTNYTQWTSNINFRTGDQLVFRYSRAAHNVVEVSRTDYNSCSGSSPIASFQTGNDVVPLDAVGTRYFICAVPGHCDGGMKVRVDVEAAVPAGGSGGAPSPVSPRARVPAAAAPMPSAWAPAAGGQAVPPSSSAASVGVQSVVGLGLGAVVAAGLMVFY